VGNGFEDCAEVKLPFKAQLREATDPRIVSAADRAIDIAKPGIWIHVCEFVDGRGLPAAVISKDVDADGKALQARLVVSRAAAVRLSDAGLLGLLTHELAHVLLVTPTACDIGTYRERTPTLEERVGCETSVNAKAASLVGKQTIITMLRGLDNVDNSLCRISKRVCSYQRAEIAACVKALEMTDLDASSAETAIIR
jgi:hypothetical protein